MLKRSRWSFRVVNKGLGSTIPVNDLPGHDTSLLYSFVQKTGAGTAY